MGVLQHGSFHKEEPPISPVNVGEHLRQLRLASGMSVWTLDTKNSFFSSLISQVEHGQVTPSIGSLERITMAPGGHSGIFPGVPEGAKFALHSGRIVALDPPMW